MTFELAVLDATLERLIQESEFLVQQLSVPTKDSFGKNRGRNYQLDVKRLYAQVNFRILLFGILSCFVTLLEIFVNRYVIEFV